MCIDPVHQHHKHYTMAHSTEKTRSKMDKNARGVRKLKLKGGRSKPAPKEVLFDDDARRCVVTIHGQRLST